MGTFFYKHRIEILLFAGFVVVAFVLRYWNYATFPVPRGDEMGEDTLALQIFHGILPLTNRAKFMGAFFQYVLSIFYVVFGNATSTARLMVVFFGSFTVGLTYLLGKELYGRIVGIIGGILLTFSVAHVLIASHVGWSASLTPFFGVLAIYIVIKVVKRANAPRAKGESGRRSTPEKKILFLFFTAGIVGGITLQTHPSSIFLLIALGIFIFFYFFVSNKLFTAGMKVSSLLVIIGGLTLGYINMVYYNFIITRFGSLTFAEKAKWTGLSRPFAIAIYESRLHDLGAELLRMLGDYMTPTTNLYLILGQPKVDLFLGLILVGTIYALIKHREADILLLLILALGILILPFGIKGFGYPVPWGPHYLMLLLPIIFILVARPLGDFISWAKKSYIRMLPALAIVGLILIYLSLTSVLTLFQLYSA